MKVLKLERMLLPTLLAALLAPVAQAQLLGEPPIPPKQKKEKKRAANLEWMWQYSPPPENGREHELIQDPEFLPFLETNFTAPQSFWGPNPTDPKAPTHKTLAQAIYDFLTIPGQVIADENRYITVTGSVFHFRTSRGLIWTDLNAKDPLIAFAAIDWIRESRPTDDPAAEYTLWIFTNRAMFGKPLPGSSEDPAHLPPPLVHSLTRWMIRPLPGTGTVQKITAAILVDPDGTPHPVPVPGGGGAAPEEAKPLPKRPSL